MITNNKAQSITQPFTLILVLFVVSLFSFAYFQFGTDLASDENSYINDQSRLKIFDQSGFKINNQTLSNELITSKDSTELFFVVGENATGNPKDYALEFQFFRQQSTDIRLLAQNLYELPTFYLRWLDLDLDDWSFFINAINLIIWTAIFFAVYKFIRGTIK